MLKQKRFFFASNYFNYLFVLTNVYMSAGASLYGYLYAVMARERFKDLRNSFVDKINLEKQPFQLSDIYQSSISTTV